MSNAIFVDETLPDVQERKPESHPHIQIRNRVHQMLSALVPAIKDRIFIAREMPLKASAYPNILIFTEGDNLVRRHSDNPIQELRQVETVIALGYLASAVDDKKLQDFIDRARFPVEQMMLDNPTLVGLVEDTFYSAGDVSVDSAGEGEFLHIRLRYNVRYYRDQSALIGGDAFVLGGVQYEINDDNEFVEMEGLIDMPQESGQAA